jgi:ferric-dicitrate binding protein FerR (iron transport regulator)
MGTMKDFTEHDRFRAAAWGVRLDSRDVRPAPDRPVVQQNVERQVIDAEAECARLRETIAQQDIVISGLLREARYRPRPVRSRRESCLAEVVGFCIAAAVLIWGYMVAGWMRG